MLSGEKPSCPGVQLKTSLFASRFSTVILDTLAGMSEKNICIYTRQQIKDFMHCTKFSNPKLESGLKASEFSLCYSTFNVDMSLSGNCDSFGIVSLAAVLSG